MQGGMHFWPPHWLPGWFPVDLYWLVPMSTRGWREEVMEEAGRSSRPRPVKPQQVFMLILCSPPAAPPPVGALQLHKPTPPFTPLSLFFIFILLHIFSLSLSFLLLFAVRHHSSPAIAFTSWFLLLVLHLLSVHLFSFHHFTVSPPPL